MSVSWGRNVHAIVLAAGEGRRVSAFTRSADGAHVPKQYCSFGSQTTLLGRALRRARSIAPLERVVVVVAEEHRRHWQSELAHLPPENVVVQPENRGTAAGVLLPALHVHDRDPDAPVLVLPSDHHVDDEPALRRALLEAVEATESDPRRLFLLGITPDAPSTDYGWILPERTSDRVSGFIEKPPAVIAADLLARGGLWNGFMLAARARALVRITSRALPELALALAWAWRKDGLVSLTDCYEKLEARDFSRDVLERVVDRLSVVRVRPCGWSDLGTPERLLRYLQVDRPMSSPIGGAPRISVPSSARASVPQSA
jgi:mannose-1-phosphate guanylyltransferase